MPAVGHRGRKLKTDQLIAEVGVPQRAAGKIHAVATDQACGFRDAAGVSSSGEDSGKFSVPL